MAIIAPISKVHVGICVAVIALVVLFRERMDPSRAFGSWFMDARMHVNTMSSNVPQHHTPANVSLRICNLSGADGTQTWCNNFVSRFAHSAEKLAMICQVSSLQASCSAVPVQVPYIVCLKRRFQEHQPTRCNHVWNVSDTSSDIKVEAKGSTTWVHGNPTITEYATINSTPKEPAVNQSSHLECQLGTLQVRDVDKYIVTSTLFHEGCDWEETSAPISCQSCESQVGPCSCGINISVTLDVQSGSCNSQPETHLPQCTGENASASSGRWILQESALKTDWSRNVYYRGGDTVPRIRSSGSVGSVVTQHVSRCINGTQKNHGYDLTEHQAWFWSPYRCEMRAFPTHMSANRKPFLGCLKPYLRKGDAYILGDSHVRESSFLFRGAARYIIWQDMCGQFPTMRGASLIVIWAGNHDLAFRKTFAASMQCVENLMKRLEFLQNHGVTIRFGVPVAYSNRQGVPNSRGKQRSWTHRAFVLWVREVRTIAARYRVPLWDAWSISETFARDAALDRCNHYSAQMYHTLWQVLCNSL